MSAHDAEGIATHHWRDWTTTELAQLEGRSSPPTTVSLVIPARDEAETVGRIVTRLREVLDHDVPLVDEIVVMDSDSSDATGSVAHDAGAQVFRVADVRADLGRRPGKGEAMWKSLFVTRGDVVVFMDADLTEWDAHFVPGLLGPLLTDPHVALVKGFYERPGEAGPLEGGRVTELVARPLLALLFPQLAGLVQPLAGEWAVRREVFASLTVPCGYAVEIAAVLDVAQRWGPGALAQVGLGHRGHRHQPLLDLGAMATQVAACAINRAGLDPVGAAAGATRLRQFGLDDDRLVRHDLDVDLQERPPARSLW